MFYNYSLFVFVDLFLRSLCYLFCFYLYIYIFLQFYYILIFCSISIPIICFLDIIITIVYLYYKKSSPFDTIEIKIICLAFFCVKNWLTCIQVIGLLIYNAYQNRSNNLNERNFLTVSVIFFSIDGIP